MSRDRIRDALEGLNSDKISERKAGIETMRDVLGQTRECQRIDGEKDGWLLVMQGLFAYVVTERNIVFKKPSTAAAAEKRLIEGTQLLRRTVERSKHLFTRKAIRALVSHLIQMSRSNDELYTPVASDYVKCLEAILSQQAHLEHLDEAQWLEAIIFCFGTLLNESTKRTTDLRDSEIETLTTPERTQPKRSGRTKAVLVDDEEEDVKPVATQSRGRAATVSQQQIGLMACIRLLVSSPAAPLGTLTTVDGVQYTRAVVLVVKLCRFLQAYPSETSAHVHAVTALIRLLSYLELNETTALYGCGPRLWTALLGIWQTKSPELKEQLIIALRYLYPFAAEAPVDPSLSDDPNGPRMRALLESILSEPGVRWRVEELYVECLSLGNKSPYHPTEPFQARNLRRGVGFAPNQAVAWTMLELGADCLAGLSALTGEVPIADALTQTARSKRRKIEDPIAALVSELGQMSGPPATHRLHLLFFLVERHWSTLQEPIQQTIFDRLEALIAHTDQRLQIWAMLCLANLAMQKVSFAEPTVVSPTKQLSPGSAQTAWDRVWTMALRRIGNKATCRAAAHLTDMLLAHDRIAPSLVISGVEGFVRELEDQGPVFPFDSICSFVGQALQLSMRDARLAQSQMPDKVAIWLSSGWQPLQAPPKSSEIGLTPRIDSVHISALISMVCRASSLPDPRVPPLDLRAPDCAIATAMASYCEMAKARNWLLQGLLDDQSDHAGSSELSEASDASIATSAAPTSAHARFASFLARSLEAAQDDMDDSSSSQAHERFRRIVDLAVIALHFDAATQTAGYQTQRELVRQATAVLDAAGARFGQSKLTAVERTTLLQSLSPLFLQIASPEPLLQEDVIGPGVMSDVRSELLGRVKPRRVSNSPVLVDALKLVWRNVKVQDAMFTISQAMVSYLASDRANVLASQGGADAMAVDADDDDDGFAPIREANVDSVTTISSSRGSLHAPDAAVTLCTRLFVTLAAMRSRMERPITSDILIEAFETAQIEPALLIAQRIFDAVEAGVLDLSATDVSKIVERFGGEVLRDYNTQRSERAVAAVLRCLEVTFAHWAHEGTASTDVAGKCRKLFSYVNMLAARPEGMPSWRLRIERAKLVARFVNPSAPGVERSNVDVTACEDLSAIRSTLDLLGDADFRVMHHAAPVVGHIFGLANFEDANQILKVIINHIARDQDETPELVCASFLANANIMVAALVQRRECYTWLMGQADASPRFHTWLRSILTIVARRLRFPSLSAMTTALYGFKVLEHMEKRQVGGDIKTANAIVVSERLTGYASRRDMAEASLPVSGASMIFRGAEGMFTMLCKTAAMSTAEGVAACFGPTAALLTCAAFVVSAERPTPDTKALKDQLGALIDQCDKSPAALGAVSPWVAASTFDLIGAEDLQTSKELLAGLKQCGGQSAVETYNKLIEDLPPQQVALSAETFEPSTCFRALQWLDKTYGALSDVGKIYLVIHRLLDGAARAPFVSGQRRKLFSVALCLALGGKAAHDARVLRMLMHGLVILLDQSDLFPAASIIFRWCENQFMRKTPRDELEAAQSYGSQLLGAARVAARHLSSGWTSAALHDLAATLLGKIESRVKTDLLTKDLGTLRQQAIEVAALWPIEGTDLIEEHDFAELAQVFLRGQPSHTDLAWARPLAQAWSMADDRDDLREVLWRLLLAAKKTTRFNVEDGMAIAELLFANGGQIEGPRLSQQHGRPNDAEAKPMTEHDIQLAIIGHLIVRFESSDLTLVHTATRTVGLVSSASTAKLFSVVKSDRSAAREVMLLSDPNLRRSGVTLKVKTGRSLAELDQGDQWTRAARDGVTWTSAFVRLLLDVLGQVRPFYAQLAPMVDADPSFASSILPLAVQSLLIADLHRGSESASRSLSNYCAAILSLDLTAKSVVRSIVDVVTHLRGCLKPKKGVQGNEVAKESDRWLPGVKWLLLAEGAVRCEAYLNALLFLELGRVYQPKELVRDSGRVNDLLYEIYAHIDEPDGFYGIEATDARTGLLRRYEHESRWNAAFELSGAAFEAGSRGGQQSPTVASAQTAELVKALSSFGFDRLSLALLTPGQTHSAFDGAVLPVGLTFDLSWRADAWDLPPLAIKSTAPSSANLYAALRAIHRERRPTAADKIISNALVAETAKLPQIDLDNPVAGSSILSTIMTLRDIRIWQTTAPGSRTAQVFAELQDGHRFRDVERLMLARASLLRSSQVIAPASTLAASQRIITPDGTQAELDCLLFISREARDAGQHQAALNAVSKAQLLDFPADDKDARSALADEYAQVLWAKGEHSVAIDALVDVLPDDEELKGDVSAPAARLYARVGEWAAAARLAAPRVLEERYFITAAELAPASDPDTVGAVNDAYARFAFAMWQAQEARRGEFEQLERYRQARMSEIDGAASGQHRQQRTRDTEAESDFHRITRLDQKQAAAFEEDLGYFLKAAVTNFAHSLKASDKFDDNVLRLCSLWLAHDADEDLSFDLAGALDDIPSHKFIVLSYQLCARYAKSTPASSETFVQTLSKLVERLCTDHPFHSLWQVLSLRKENGNGSAASAPRPSGRKSVPESTQVARDIAAGALLDRLRRHKSKLIATLEHFSAALKVFAEWHITRDEQLIAKDNGGKYEIPSRYKLRDFSAPDIPIVSLDLPVQRDCKYETSRISCVKRYGTTFTTAGGVNLPKLIYVSGTDGSRHRELIKGRDDVRQDAVMEQVFSLVNRLFDRDQRTKQRRLHIRTYNIVPLQGTNGVLQFVHGGRAVSDVLISMHDSRLYHPDDWEIKEARGHLSKQRDKETAEKVEAFRLILKKVHPVFRHYFFEAQRSAAGWFELRLNYQRSLAAMCIVGWMLGIGDRHTSNMLLDIKTGELVGIDFGVAFESGKRLPIPELVPFRLTQDFVDALGMNGLSGVFKRCSEETLRVLRSQAQIILTIIDVLKKWTVTAQKASKAQGDALSLSDEDVPAEAARALNTVANKLNSKLEIDHQVSELILAATNEENLAGIFHGWQPCVDGLAAPADARRYL